MADGRKNRRKAMENTAQDQRRKMDAIRKKERVIAYDLRQRNLLSYLNKEQLKMWKSYSPSRQRKILQEVEKRLGKREERKESQPETMPVRVFDTDSFLDEEDHSPCQIRGHPENVHLRKVEMSDIRTRKMKLRMARDLSKKKGLGQRTVSSQMPAVSRKQKGAGMAAASKRNRLLERGQEQRGIDAALSDKGIVASANKNSFPGKILEMQSTATLRKDQKRQMGMGEKASDRPGAFLEAKRIEKDRGKRDAADIKSLEKEDPLPRPAEDRDIKKDRSLLGERRSVILGKKKKEKQLFRMNFAPGPSTQSGGRKVRLFLKDKESRKRAHAYQKSFLKELTSVIEKDIRKDENIKRAQKTGQISQSISELTDQTGRSAFRISALPLRTALGMLTKRLRSEIKKRLKEAAASLMRFAAVFGAPVFAIVIIVMLLSAICMIGTSEETPTGYGLGWQIVEEAKKHIGLPYVYGGTSLKDGCDCSGFVWAIYNLFGYNLPRTAGAQYSYGRKVGKDISDWQLGDLIYYSKTGSVQSGGGRAEHIVIYIGGGQVISCGPVAIYNWDYRSDYYGTCRIIPDEPLGGDFSGSTNEEICWNYFISKGFSKAAAAGILGNMYVESAGTFDPSIHQIGGGPGRGLCQWEESYSGGSGRYNKLAAFASGIGKKWDDISAQLMFASYEMDSGQLNYYFSKFGGVEAFKRSKDPATAAYVFLCGFEYCGDPGRSFLEANFALSLRESHARWAYKTYG